MQWSRRACNRLPNDMKYTSLPYSDPPGALRKVRLDNIALVPASLLPLKETYQVLANRLPTGSVLIVSETQRQQKILAKVTQFFRSHGRQVISLPIERITRPIRKRVPIRAENMQFVF